MAEAPPDYKHVANQQLKGGQVPPGTVPGSVPCAQDAYLTTAGPIYVSLCSVFCLRIIIRHQVGHDSKLGSDGFMCMGVVRVHLHAMVLDLTLKGRYHVTPRTSREKDFPAIYHRKQTC